MINGTAYAQSESSEMQEVEVPQAPGSESMKELVLKLNENQTAALIELISLPSTPTDKNKTLPAVGSQGALEIIKQWVTGFGDNLELR